MKIFFLADLHFSLKQYDWLLAQAEKHDLIVIGGDLLDLGGFPDLDTQIGVIENYLARLMKTSQLVVSSGNHDGDSRNSADESTAQWLQDFKSDGLHVDGDGFFLQDTRITVCPWWDGDLSRAELESLLERESKLVKERWIWIHHAPPAGANTSWTGKRFIGDEYLRKWIDRHHPAMVLSGHIHNAPFSEPGSWIDRIGTTWVFNVGRQTGSEPTSLTIDLDAMTAEWKCAWDASVRDLRELNG